jgi:hypothetical protein
MYRLFLKLLIEKPDEGWQFLRKKPTVSLLHHHLLYTIWRRGFE